MDNLPTISNIKISESYKIPEPTRSLLFVTNENTSKISSPFQLKITISFNQEVESKIDDGHNFFAEPSLIWTQLPIKKNNELETKPMYYPAYSSLTPEHRYQYLCWLRDITQPTNLSYVFLYYYGLERNLLVGNFDLAVQEVFKLLKYHDKGTFRSYAQNALIVSALHKNRIDIFEKDSFLFDSLSNESLIIRKKLDYKISANELMNLSYVLGFKNKRYIKLYPEDFLKELDKLMIEYENVNGSLLNSVSFEDMESIETSVFANNSLPKKVRTVKVPQLISNSKFNSICTDLLERTHNSLKTKRNKKIA
ncbi:MAG: TerB N-terminal domain-containing protein [Candidatus Paceibacterota bacterium]|jgi:hypothetical protein